MKFSFNRAGLIDGSILSAALGSNAMDEREIDIGTSVVEELLVMGRNL